MGCRPCWMHCFAHGPLPWAKPLPRRWVAMQPYFYHDIPTTAGDWLRERHSGAQHGRIAVLKPDKWCSYMEYHLKLVSEGLLEGDRWHLISVQENLLFSYLEEPRTHVNNRHQPGVPSAELQEWLAVDPESHFEHFAKEQQGPVLQILFISPAVQVPTNRRFAQ